MSTHKLITSWEVVFEDGTVLPLEKPDTVYCFNQQKYDYLTLWLEALIKKYNITNKPIEIREKINVVECDEYRIILGM